MRMGTRETASRPNHQPLPAHLDRFAGTAEENQAKDSPLPIPLWPSVVNEPKTYGLKQSVSDPSAPNSSEINSTYGITEPGLFFVKTADLPPRTPRTTENRAKASLLCVPLWPSVVNEPECSGSKPSATDPLHTNSNEIIVPSGVAAGTAFSVEKSKAAFLFFHTLMRAPRNRASGVSSLESRRLAAPTPAASVPLAVKPFEINGSSGTAAWTPFFVKKNKSCRLSCLVFSPRNR